jgi:gliding motility-associated-like protein
MSNSKLLLKESSNQMMRLALCISLLSCSTIFGQAPVFFNQANVFVAANAEVHVFGDMITDGITSVLENEGFIQTYNDGNPGNFELQNESTVLSIGNFMIENDWVNNGLLQIQTGFVEMYGDNQWFLGDSISSFWDLTLTGTDRKEQGQKIRVRSVLDLTDRELAVHAQTVFIDDANANAIVFDNTFNAEGIISTDEDGFIKKYLNQNELNLIPTGSSQGSFRHRPLKALLTAGDLSDTAIITFHRHSPDLLNAFEIDMDTSLCRIQNEYFYTFNAANSSNTYQLDLAHYPPTDGLYPDVAQWDNPTWKVLYDDGDYSDVNYQYASANNEIDFINEHYTLGYRTPPKPYVLFDSTECYSDAVYQVEVPLGQPWYEWTVVNSDGSAYISDGQGTDLATVDWSENIGGWVYASYDDAEGCRSHTDSMLIYDVSINADFHYTNNYSSGMNTEFTFINQSTLNTDEVEWFIQNQSTWFTDPTMTMPYNYTFTTDGEGVYYEVVLIAYDYDYGCIDTAIKIIHVPTIFVFYAPNTITPNQDGSNDFFFGTASDISWAELEIYNRWGELIFNEEGAVIEELIWDGRFNGQIVPDGTYTYKFTIKPVNYNNGELSAFEYLGHITVVR